MGLTPALLATAPPSGGVGLGIAILAVGILMAGGAAISLRGIWSKATPPDPLARQGPIAEPRRPWRSPAVGDLQGRLRLLVSFDFGCLALVAVALIFTGLAVIFRSL
ncbi:MAG: hypothetical protein ACRENY_00850 [Candidatus Dormibacteria bacterium]